VRVRVIVVIDLAIPSCRSGLGVGTIMPVDRIALEHFDIDLGHAVRLWAAHRGEGRHQGPWLLGKGKRFRGRVAAAVVRV
jgi:hypothetical protein